MPKPTLADFAVLSRSYQPRIRGIPRFQRSPALLEQRELFADLADLCCYGLRTSLKFYVNIVWIISRAVSGCSPNSDRLCERQRSNLGPRNAQWVEIASSRQALLVMTSSIWPKST